jgi:hypothetical protein
VVMIRLSMASREGRRVVLRQSDLGDWWSDPALGDVVQPSSESRRTAPPEESAAGRAIHSGEKTAVPSNHASYDRPNLSSK